MKQKEIILGGPGCGKTSHILKQYALLLEQGVAPADIAYVTFNKAAVVHTKERAIKELGIPWQAVKNFTTIHSLAFNSVIERRPPLLPEDYVLFGEKIGERMTRFYSADKSVGEQDAPGDKMLAILNIARNRMVDPLSVLIEYKTEVSPYRMQRFMESFARFKQELNKTDFTGMLENFLTEGNPSTARYLFVDEAQDLTPLQWEVIFKAFANTEYSYFAGDDDQAIYTWSGVVTASFLNLVHDKRTVLDHSHRLPAKIMSKAREITGRIQDRFEKEFSSREEPGVVQYLNDPETLDISTGDWFLLARNGYMLKQFEEVLLKMGYLFTRGRQNKFEDKLAAIHAWNSLLAGEDVHGGQLRLVQKYSSQNFPVEQDNFYSIFDFPDAAGRWQDVMTGFSAADVDYLERCLKNGEKVPRIRIDTFHGVKGLEATNVVMKTDMSYRTYKGMETDPDAENRCFYIPVTRARQNLFILLPQTDKAFNI